MVVEVNSIKLESIFKSKWSLWLKKYPILSCPDVYLWLQAKAQKFAVGRDISKFKLQTYIKYLQDYCTYFKVTDVTNLLHENIEKRNDRLRNYLNHLLEQGVNKVSVKNAIQSKIKSFFSARGFPIKYQLKVESSGLNYKEIILTKESIQMIENELNSPNYRLILKIQTQLGLRISDILDELPSGNYSIERHEAHYFIRNFKTQKEQVIINYLFFPDELSKFMQSTTKKSDLTKLNLSILFSSRQKTKIKAHVYLRQLKIVAKKLGLIGNIKTNSFRKYFQACLKQSNIDRRLYHNFIGQTETNFSMNNYSFERIYSIWVEQIEPLILINTIIRREKKPITQIKQYNLIIIDMNNFSESFKRLNLPRGMNIFASFERWIHNTFPLIQGERKNKIQVHLFYSQYLEPILKSFTYEYIPYCETKMKYGGKAADVDTTITGEMVWRIRTYSKQIKSVYLFSGDKDLEMIATECNKFKIPFHIIVTNKSILSHELKNKAVSINELY